MLYGGPTFPDVSSLMSDGRPDLVSIATPPGAHAEVAAQVLRAGGSVLIEKPPCPTLAELDVIAEAEREGGGAAYVVFQHRHGSGARRAAELLGSGALGRPLVAVCETLWFRPDSYFDPDWRGTWSGEGGGPTLGHGIHQIDLLLHLLGPWRQLTATAVRQARPVEFEDVSLATIGFEDGAVATMINSLLSPRELSRIRIDTTAGTLEVNHVYGYRDADWSFFPLPSAEAAATLGRDPGVRDDTDAAPERNDGRFGRRLGRQRRPRRAEQPRRPDHPAGRRPARRPHPPDDPGQHPRHGRVRHRGVRVRAARHAGPPG